ncbi:MAG: hypothetical protein U0T65_00980 [Buchnera aphidicola (Nurudea yanoniella)]
MKYKSSYYGITQKLLKYAVILFLISFIILNSFILIKFSQQLSNKKISHLIIKGKFHYFNKNALKNFILSLKKPYNTNFQYNIFLKNELKKLPFIRNIKINALNNDTLLIYLENFNPIAYWNDKYILNENGVSTKIIKSFFSENILRFYGSKNSIKDFLNNYNTVQNVLKKNNILLKSIIITSQNSWKLFIQNNIEIILGKLNYTNIMRLKRLMNVWKFLTEKERTMKKKIKHIDIRYISGIAIEWT